MPVVGEILFYDTTDSVRIMMRGSVFRHQRLVDQSSVPAFAKNVEFVKKAIKTPASWQCPPVAGKWSASYFSFQFGYETMNPCSVPLNFADVVPD